MVKPKSLSEGLPKKLFFQKRFANNLDKLRFQIRFWRQ